MTYFYLSYTCHMTGIWHIYGHIPLIYLSYERYMWVIFVTWSFVAGFRGLHHAQPHPTPPDMPDDQGPDPVDAGIFRLPWNMPLTFWRCLSRKQTEQNLPVIEFDSSCCLFHWQGATYSLQRYILDNFIHHLYTIHIQIIYKSCNMNTSFMYYSYNMYIPFIYLSYNMDMSLLYCSYSMYIPFIYNSFIIHIACSDAVCSLGCWD